MDTRTLAMDLIENKFLLVIVGEEGHPRRLRFIAKLFEKAGGRVCYVCLGRTYKDALGDLKKSGMNTGAFIFIDALSSHYEKPRREKNCIFLDSPYNLESIEQSIHGVAEKEKCGVLLVDAISDLLEYHEKFPVLRFAHALAARENMKKILIALKKGGADEKENAALIGDLEMFADRTIDLAGRETG